MMAPLNYCSKSGLDMFHIPFLLGVLPHEEIHLVQIPAGIKDQYYSIGVPIVKE